MKTVSLSSERLQNCAKRLRFLLGHSKYMKTLPVYHESLMQWLQLRFDFDSTAVRQTFERLSKVINVTVR